MSVYIISAATGISGLFIGLLIGYYKSKADFTERLSKMMSKKDCSDCDLRGQVANLNHDLDAGSDAFREIRKDIGSIQGDIQAMKAIMEERAKGGNGP